MDLSNEPLVQVMFLMAVLGAVSLTALIGIAIAKVIQIHREKRYYKKQGEAILDNYLAKVAANQQRAQTWDHVREQYKEYLDANKN